MPLNVSTAWLNSARLTRRAVALIRIHSGASSEPIGICGGQSMIHDGVSYRDLLGRLPEGSRGFDIKTHRPIIGNWRLDLKNGEYFQGKRLSDQLAQIQNRLVEIRQCVPGIDAWDDLPEYMVGQITKPKQNDRAVNLDVMDRNRLIHRKVPEMVGSSDAADGEMLPEGSLGKAKPEIMGDRRSHIGSTTASLTNLSRAQGPVPAVPLGIDSSERHWWLLAGHKMLGMGTDESDSDEVCMKDEEIGRMVRLSAFTVEQNDENGCIISHANLAPVYDYHYPDGTVENLITANGGEIQNAANAANKNKNNYAYLTAPDTDFGPEERSRAYFEVSFPTWDGNASLIDNVKIYARTEFDDDGCVDGPPTFTIQQVDARSNSPDVFAFIKDETNPATKVLVEIYGGYDCPEEGHLSTAKVYATFRRIKYTPESQMPVYSGSRGRDYDEPINGRSTAEGYSESHVDDDGSGNPIKNPAGILEWICRKWMNQNAEHLAENGIGAAPTKWAKTGDFEWLSGGAKLDYPGSGGMNGTIKQTAANRVLAGKGNRNYRLKYKVTVTTAPDGDFVLKVVDGFADGAVSLPFTDGTHVKKFKASAGAAAADFLIQASESTATQGVLVITPIYLEIDEIDLDAFNIASQRRSTWKMAPAIVERRITDEIIGEIARQCGLYTWHQPGGTVKVIALEETYSSQDVVIDLEHVIGTPDFEWTPLDWLMTRVKVLYNWNGERYMSQTEFAEDADQQAYYSVERDPTTEDLECRGIHEEATAILERNLYLANWKQQHVLGHVGLPLRYSHVDAGDIVRYTYRGKPYRVFNEDITVNHTRSGQMIYKYFLVYKVDPKMVGSMIHCFQLHDLS